jgi:hypothetical protein
MIAPSTEPKRTIHRPTPSEASPLEQRRPAAKTQNTAHPNPTPARAIPTIPTHNPQNTMPPMMMDATPSDRPRQARKPRRRPPSPPPGHKPPTAPPTTHDPHHNQPRERPAPMDTRSVPTHQCPQHNPRPRKSPQARPPTPNAMPAPRQRTAHVNPKTQSLT